MHFSIAKKPAAPFSEINAISERLEKVLRAVGAARARQQLSVDEAFIFLVAGYRGVSKSRSGVTIRAVSCIDIANILNIPRETVRRKAATLVGLQLASMTSRGILIENLDEWRLLAEAMLQ